MNTDRERSILKILVHDKKVTVKDLSTRLFTSEPSIRRDLVSLERQHLLKRIYGGAILDDNDVSRQRIPFLLRELEQSQEKVTIAKKGRLPRGRRRASFLTLPPVPST
ncbi:MAG: DeoR family transcriptional regulator [Lachnospiraceae bacterium]